MNMKVQAVTDFILNFFIGLAIFLFGLAAYSAWFS